MKTYTRNGKTIRFFQKPGDNKYSFVIEGDPNLTARILENVKTKRVRADKLYHAARGIFNLIDRLGDTHKNIVEHDIMTKLNHNVQNIYGANIRIYYDIYGKNLNQIVNCEIILPDGRVFEGVGDTKRSAKEDAASRALKKLL